MDLTQLIPEKNKKLSDALDAPKVVILKNPFTDKPLVDEDGELLSLSVHYAFSEVGRNLVIQAKRDEEDSVEPVTIVAHSIVGMTGTIEFGKKKVTPKDIGDKELLKEMLNEVPFVFEQVSIAMTNASNFLPKEMLN
jgi:hypothetical protein